MVIFFPKFRKNYKELSGLPNVWIRMKCTIWIFSPKCVSVLGKEKCAEKPKYIWTKCLLMFCFNSKFSSYGGKINNLKKCTLLKCTILQNPESITTSPYSDITSEKNLQEGTYEDWTQQKRKKEEYNWI